MALPPLAEPTALAEWLGRDSVLSDARAGAVLSHASTKVRRYTGQAWVDEVGALTEVPDIVAEVTVRVAARAYLNPEDLDSVTLDDGTKRWGTTRGLVLTDEDKEDLAEYVPVTGVIEGFGTISTNRGDTMGDETVYVPTAPEPAGYPFPWYDASDL